MHESLVITGGVGYLKNDLLHYSYNTISEYWERFNKYTTLDAEKRKVQGKKFNVFSIFIFQWELFKRLILKLGILDGVPGIFYHIFSSISPVVKYAKLWEKEIIKKGPLV